MAKIAQVNRTVTDQEFDAMVEALQSNWDLSPQEAAFVAQVAVSEIAPNMDTVRLVRDVSSSVPPEKADALLDTLFAVAAADGYVTDAEMDVIYSIARALGLSHRTFIDAKLRIPAEKREG
jgi:tellurite resistance protein